MRKQIFCMALVLLAIGATAQTVPSDCTAPYSIRQKYLRDAQGLACDRIKKFNSPYKDSVLIPTVWSDSIMRALMAVYNAISLPERDSVIVKYRVHCFRYNNLSDYGIRADKSLPWVADMKMNIFPTSDAAVNALMVKYDLRRTYYTEMGDAFLYFSTSKLINHEALDKEWKATIPGVKTDPSLYMQAGDGSMIYVDTVTPLYTQLRYAFACGDCPAGCIYRRCWQFRVNTQCQVEYLGSYGSALSSADCMPLPEEEELIDSSLIITDAERFAVGISPNPFADFVRVKPANISTRYVIVNILGSTVASGSLPMSGIIDTRQLAVGSYVMKLISGKGIECVKLEKKAGD